jgi:hypothetical protein|tara:strand:- start:443 stop:1648 length:1206 start_codon:yes stop_codon:yes gene_type:complete
MTYIEDILHIVVDTIVPDTADREILKSISRQCKKGTALTDRQFELIKSKMWSYEKKLKEHNIDLTSSIEPRLPIRSIDRSQYVTITNSIEVFENKVYESYKDNWKWIKIRFPFSKKNIVLLESLSSKHGTYYHHSRGSHEHYFKLTEVVIKDVVNAFINKSFTIDQQLLDYYTEILPIAENPLNYTTALVNNEFKNLNSSAIEIINKEIGTIDNTNILKLYDRRFRYGINSISVDIPGNLTGHIANRETQELLINPSSFNLNQVVEGIVNLDRFPILVLIDTPNELEQVSKVYNAFNNIVPNSKQTVLFRVDQSTEYVINDYIRDKSLNNWLDNTTEIVYINKSKLPKLLLKTNWTPMCILSLSSNRSNSHVATYIKDMCDLIIYYDTQESIMKRSKYGIM